MVVVTEKRQRTWRIAERKLRDGDSLSRQSSVQLAGLQSAADSEFALPFLSFSSSKFRACGSDLSTYQLVIDLQGGSTANWGLWALGHFSRPFRVPFLLFRAAIKEG